MPAAAGDDFVGVGLVADVPDELVGGRVVAIMKHNCQFHHPQARRKMSAVPADRVQHGFADFSGNLRKLGNGKLLQIFGRIYRIKQFHVPYLRKKWRAVVFYKRYVILIVQFKTNFQ